MEDFATQASLKLPGPLRIAGTARVERSKRLGKNGTRRVFRWVRVATWEDDEETFGNTLFRAPSFIFIAHFEYSA